MFEESCDAADVPFQTCLCLCGLQLSVKGYSDKQNILLKKIIEKMATFEIDERRFDIIKEAVSAAGLHPQLQEASSSSADVSPHLPPLLLLQYMRSLNNFRAEQPHQHAMYYLRLLMTEVAWTKDELKEALDGETSLLISVSAGSNNKPGDKGMIFYVFSENDLAPPASVLLKLFSSVRGAGKFCWRSSCSLGPPDCLLTWC